MTPAASAEPPGRNEREQRLLVNARYPTRCADLQAYLQPVRLLRNMHMDREELLAQMIATPAIDRDFNDWPEVLANYAECLVALQPRLPPEELERLVRVGADFYRTLARAEQYRHMSVWDEQQP